MWRMVWHRFRVKGCRDRCLIPAPAAVSHYMDLYEIAGTMDRGSREMVSDAVVAAGEDPDTYVEAVTSPGDDRWVQCMPRDLQFPQEKLK